MTIRKLVTWVLARAAKIASRIPGENPQRHTHTAHTGGLCAAKLSRNKWDLKTLFHAAKFIIAFNWNVTDDVGVHYLGALASGSGRQVL